MKGRRQAESYCPVGTGKNNRGAFIANCFRGRDVEAGGDSVLARMSNGAAGDAAKHHVRGQIARRRRRRGATAVQGESHGQSTRALGRGSGGNSRNGIAILAEHWQNAQ